MSHRAHPHIHFRVSPERRIPGFDGEAWMGSFVIVLLVATIAALVAGCWLPGF